MSPFPVFVVSISTVDKEEIESLWRHFNDFVETNFTIDSRVVTFLKEGIREWMTGSVFTRPCYRAVVVIPYLQGIGAEHDMEMVLICIDGILVVILAAVALIFGNRLIEKYTESQEKKTKGQTSTYRIGGTKYVKIEKEEEKDQDEPLL